MEQVTEVIKIAGRVVEVMPSTSGTSKAGKQWTKTEYIIETLDKEQQYRRKICVEVWGTAIRLEQGNAYELSVDIESRPYNGKWYTSIRAYKYDAIPESILKTIEQSVAQTPPTSVQATMPHANDLPF